MLYLEEINSLSIGDRFGLWTITGLPRRIKNGSKPMFVCDVKCDCGISRTHRCYDLLTSRTKSCGCRGRNMHRPKAGDKYHYWTIVSEAKKVDGARYMNCICECGWKAAIRLQELVRNRSKSCGCKRKEHLMKIRLQKESIAS